MVCSCCPPRLSRHSKQYRRALFAPSSRSSWLSAVAVLVLVWIYLNHSGPNGWPPGSRHRPPPLHPHHHPHPHPHHGGYQPFPPFRPPPQPPATDDTKEPPPPEPTMTLPKPAADDAPSSSTSSALPIPTAILPQGIYVGATLPASNRFPKSIDAFRGIPYAETTGGENRFRPPVPLPPSNYTYLATRFGPTCPREAKTDKDSGEDCLNANIYRPAALVGNDGFLRGSENGTTKGRPRLPVVVYVHGGAFNGGTGKERNMASFVAWADAPMIGINFNYRVGALGFLPSALTAREGLLNLGLRDQQLMLEWVRDNIEAFGGDPDNVTIMGVSAGSHSIGHHIMSYAQAGKKAPFVKAILESGATTARAVFYPTHPRHLVQFEQFLLEAGIPGVAEREVFARLRELPLDTIVKASRAVWDMYVDTVTWPFQPVIDGPNALANSSRHAASSPAPTVLPDLPINLWRDAKHLRIPVLTGFNTNEGTSFVPTSADTNEDFREFFRALIPHFNDADLAALEKLYPDPVKTPRDEDNPYRTVPKGVGRQFMRLDAAYSHYAYICPVLQTAHFLSRSGDGDTKAPPVHVYRFAATAARGTANHGDEGNVVSHDMDSLAPADGPKMPGLLAVADAMHGAWWRFVVSKTGDPNEGAPDGATKWPAFVSPFSRDETDPTTETADKGEIAVFGDGNNERFASSHHGSWFSRAPEKNPGVPVHASALSDFERQACAFWWARIELSEGFGVRGQDERRGPRDHSEDAPGPVAAVRAKL
ncbi:Alpha/Beta hydrolase protein [Lasiosphaeria ovina]|uniref:Alpha/Beta hydrolase protein n=1 Tax=Lasiosphaeria ovina TaxID=92902 RepID=A0AAE0N6S9_9PEZI|nr:Alpha/Beta hydrolase protein [Lasiosphaeria ovina]